MRIRGAERSKTVEVRKEKRVSNYTSSRTSDLLSDETGMIRRAVMEVAKDLAEEEKVEADDDDANHWSDQTLAFPNN